MQKVPSLLARPKRFELLTPRFVVWCSIQLSYGRFLRLRGPGGLRFAREMFRPADRRNIGISYRFRSRKARQRPGVVCGCLRPRPLAPAHIELDRPIRDGETERRSD